MLLQDDSGIKYQLSAFSDGKYLLKTEHELLSRYLSFDSDPDFSEYMVQLSEDMPASRAIQLALILLRRQDYTEDQLSIKEYVDPFTGEPVKEGKLK